MTKENITNVSNNKFYLAWQRANKCLDKALLRESIVWVNQGSFIALFIHDNFMADMERHNK